MYMYMAIKLSIYLSIYLSTAGVQLIGHTSINYHIYAIILLKSVSRCSQTADRNFSLARSYLEISQTVRFNCRSFHSRGRPVLAILFRRNQKNGHSNGVTNRFDLPKIFLFHTLLFTTTVTCNSCGFNLF